jgi:hypothetical protein
MGVTPEQSYTLVHRMRERVERALGALVVARAGRRDCDDLAGILGAWNGEFTILIRKRVARHVEACDTCTRTRAKAAPIALLGAAPAMAMPIGLRERVLGAASAATPAPGNGGQHGYSFDGPGGFPGLVRTGTRAAAWIVAAAAVLFIAMGGAILLQSTRATESALITATTAAAIDTIAASTTVADAGTTSTPPSSGPTTSAGRQTTTTATGSTSTSASVPSGLTPATTTTPTPSPTTVPVVVPTAPTTPTPTPTVTPTTTAPTTTTPTTTTEPQITTTTTSTTSTTVPPGRLTVSSNVIDLGSGSTAVVTVTNTGGSPIDWSIRGSAAPFSLATTPGTLGPGDQSAITITLRREGLAEGNYAATVTILGGDSASLTILATVNRAPQVDITRVDACIDPAVYAAVSDESSVTLTLGWSGPENGATTMSLRNGVWTARAKVSTEGLYVFTVQAMDALGNSGSDVASAKVSNCIG